MIASRRKELRGHSLAERAVKHDERGSWTVGKCLRVSQTSLSCSSKMESWVWEGEGEMLGWEIGCGAERGSWLGLEGLVIVGGMDCYRLTTPAVIQGHQSLTKRQYASTTRLQCLTSDAIDKKTISPWILQDHWLGSLSLPNQNNKAAAQVYMSDHP